MQMIFMSLLIFYIVTTENFYVLAKTFTESLKLFSNFPFLLALCFFMLYNNFITQKGQKMKGIYTYYKERLIEISGKNRSLYTRKSSKKYSYDIGKLLDGDFDAVNEFLDFLWNEKTYSYPLIAKSAKDRLFKNLGVESSLAKSYANLTTLSGKEKSEASFKLERQKREETKKAINSQITLLKNLKREIEEFSKETGRYELYVGYPYVQGAIDKDVLVKAPLFLFPVSIEIIDENTIHLEAKKDENVQLNKVFLLAYSRSRRISLEEMEMEFRGKLSSSFKNIQDAVNYLRKFNVKLDYSARKGIFSFEKSKESFAGDRLEIKHYAILGRFPLANSIYNDYSLLEKRWLTNEAIDELIYAKTPKKIKKPDTHLYTISNLDFAQQNAISTLNEKGNIVIYGPPGTGKSQTIVNIITDAICKNKRVLVVSQKKAALDVVFNRLGTLSSKAMYIIDPEKNKTGFYERAKVAHEQVMAGSLSHYNKNYDELQDAINKEEEELEIISDTLFTPRPFGLTLQQMYNNSYILGKTSYDYTIYQNMLKTPELLDLRYNELSENLKLIKDKKKAEVYYQFLEEKKLNPFVDELKPNIEFHTLTQTKSTLQKLLAKRLTPFDFARYPNARQFVSYYVDKKLDINKISPLVKFVAKDSNPKTANALKVSYYLFPLYPFMKAKMNQKEKETLAEFQKILHAIEEYTNDFKFLQDVLTDNGYTMLVGNLLNGNWLYLKLLNNALDSYVQNRDINIMLHELNDIEKIILNFAYNSTTTKAHYLETLQKLLKIRIYHEVTMLEDENKESLARIIDYDNAKNRIISLTNERNNISRLMCDETFQEEYRQHFNSDQNNKNFLYQLTKQQNQWPIRKFMETFGDYMFKLFPCWLLSPESACTILPLVKNLFDIVLFDEASQVFIENTLPVIYRGKNIVVAGDSKQLRPTATFMKRYLGNDQDDEIDLSTQAALEVESLLDLAMSRYTSVHLTYHYRSRSEELINFSNNAFYDGRLEIAPNITKTSKPITRIKVNGSWINRKNLAEAKAVVELLKKLFNNRKHKESIGIITFNLEQETAIEDAIDQECNKNPRFRDQFLKEQNRKENGEDISIFVKNLENVQGDERDIIIFSIGYARNEYGKVVAHFGPLSTEGGENRLNVAITRAKSQIYVVTSIEPEELNVETTKNAGPKIFKNYLRYVRAVSNGNQTEKKIILEGALNNIERPQDNKIINDLEKKIKAELEGLGYRVDTNLGNADYKISLGIYDKELERYLVGVECDYTAYESSDSIMERDVFRPTFLKTRGWDIIRIYSRDWWLSKSKVLAQIIKIADRNKQKYLQEGGGFKKSTKKQDVASLTKTLKTSKIKDEKQKAVKNATKTDKEKNQPKQKTNQKQIATSATNKTSAEKKSTPKATQKTASKKNDVSKKVATKSINSKQKQTSNKNAGKTTAKASKK